MTAIRSMPGSARGGIWLIAPHRAQRRQATQDGRELRRYGRRSQIERLFAWLHHFRRPVTRWEYYAENDLGFVQRGCRLIFLCHL
jgi:transposase